MSVPTTGPETLDNWVRTILFLPPQATDMAAEIDHLHYFVIATTMVGAAFVGLLAIAFSVRYKRPGSVSRDLGPTRRDDSPTTSPAVEWSLAGGLFTLFMVWWAIGFSQYVRIRVAPPDTYDIYVTAKQWMWKFAYREGNHSVTTLYVPAGRPVKLIMTSRDVIHSFYVPDFRIKQDVIPGRYTTLWFNVKEPGRHEILCAEYCGVNHSTMRGEVIALDEADFARWLERTEEGAFTDAPSRQYPTVATALGPSQQESLVRIGEQIAAQEGCLRCHSLDGTNHIGPSWAGLYRATVPLEGGGTLVADEAYLTESMMDPNARVHAGYKAVMPSYQGRLRPGETAALIELIRSLEHVRGQAPSQPASGVAPATGWGAAAGRMGVPPEQPATPLEQEIPARIAAPDPASAGVPPPGATVYPPIQEPVRVGRDGPILAAPQPPGTAGRGTLAGADADAGGAPDASTDHARRGDGGAGR